MMVFFKLIVEGIVNVYFRNLIFTMEKTKRRHTYMRNLTMQYITYNLHFGDSNSDLSDSLSAYSEHSNSYRPYGMYLFILFFV